MFLYIVSPQYQFCYSIPFSLGLESVYVIYSTNPRNNPIWEETCTITLSKEQARYGSFFLFIQSGRKREVFRRHLELLKTLISTYIGVKIVTGLHRIQVCAGDDLVTSFPQPLGFCKLMRFAERAILEIIPHVDEGIVRVVH